MKDKNTSAAVIELVPFSEQMAAANRWQGLEQSIGNTGLTNSWPWIKTWLDNYSDTVQPVFAFGKRDDRPIGAALIVRATCGIRSILIPSVCGVRSILIPSVHLGTAGEPGKETAFVERNQLLVAPEHLDAFAIALIHTLRQRFRWSELRLDGFVPHHADALIRSGANIGLQFRKKEERSPAFDFQKAQDEGYQDVLSALGSNTRYNIRRSMRLFDSTFGRQKIEWAETREQAKDILAELIELHQKRWQRVKKPGAFPTDRTKRYHEDLIDALSLWPQGFLIVFRLKQGNMTIGCVFNFIDEERQALLYKSGFPFFDDNRLKPGLVTLAVFMEECKRRGLLEEEKRRQRGLSEEECSKSRLLKYDFLVGGEYKEHLSNTASNLTWATAGGGLRSWIADQAYLLFLLARERVSSNK